MSRGRTGVQHSMQGVFVFVLLGLFALMSTLLVLLGAQMYRASVNAAQQNNQARVLSAYVRSMVRAEDAKDSVAVEELGGQRVIALYEDIDDERYVTWIYCYDGQIQEQFTDAGYDFDPEDGTPICRAEKFEPEIANGLLTIAVADETGYEGRIQVALHCGDNAQRE